VLLCHATGLHAAVWEPLSAALPATIRRWAMDFRAHGASVVPPDTDLPWVDMRDDVLCVVDHLDGQAEGLIGVGHSMGGAALVLAEQARPGTFAGLWLFEPILPPPAAAQAIQGGNALADGAARRRSSFPSRAEALANYAGKRPLGAWRADVLHAYVRHGFVDGEDGQVHLACRPDDESRIFRGGGAHGASVHLDEVRCPVVVACGGEPFGPAAFASSIAEGLPHGRLEAYEHLDHFGPQEAPVLLADAIAEFVELVAR
jgi:pimeloyl-ACP methyl ester carboxylesterase